MAYRGDKVNKFYQNISRKNNIQGFYNQVTQRNNISGFYVNRGRQYYGAALDESNDPRKDIVWSDSPMLYRQPKTSLLKAGALTGGVLLAGKIPLPGGGRVWDKYVSGLRHFEEYFFAKIPRTLQLSNIASQFETAARQTRLVTPGQLAQWSKDHISYLEKITGVSSYSMLRQGLRFENGKVKLADTGITILHNAGVVRNINKSAHFLTSYARSQGLTVTDKLFQESLAFTNSAGKELSEAFQFIGGHSRAEHIKRQFFGFGTELIERANRLAKADFELPVLGPVLKKVFGRYNLGVKSGAGLETLARLTGKLGIFGGGLVLGYKTADWAVRNSKIFDNTIFNQGITAGAGTIWAKLNLGYSQIGDVTGWTEHSRHQEKYAPGSTDIQKLLAFPLMGAVGAASAHWIGRGILTARLQARGHEVAAASEIASKLLKRFHGSGLVSTLGRWFRESKYSVVRSLAKSPLTVMATMGAAIGAIPVLPFLFNALAPTHTQDELRDIYSGRKEEAVKKGRWWSMGRSPFEGTNTQYYRQNWYARMMQGGKEKTIWGPLEQNGELSPIHKFFTKNFTYDLERAHYSDMPYPVTGKAFDSVPILGPVLSATIGRIIKPAVMMHQNEFYNSDSGKYLNLSQGFGIDRNTGMGEQGPGTPISPHGIKGTISEQFYRFQQLTGLPGFLVGSIKSAITGTNGLFDQEKYLASADEIDSPSRTYYDMNLGDMGMTNELFRRLLPHKQNEIETYNPIKNSMPDWLPSSGDRGPDLQHGNPYAAIPEGEIRLPGAGYEAAHPELKGLDPNDYPDIWKYKILGDVAPFSEKFGDVESRVAVAYRKGQLTDAETQIYHDTQDQIKEKRNKRTFNEYKYRKENLDPVQQALADWNNSKKDPSNEPSWFEKTLGSYWETLSHNAETPLEYITPLSPAHKLIHMRSATEDYARNQVWGTESGFWDRPWSNFIRPFLTSTSHVLGNDDIPESVKNKRKLEEYFDILKYLKFTRLKNVASSSNDQDAVKQFEQKRRETLFGVNPYTFDYSEIFRALPRRDRDYFNVFTETKDLDKRAEILKMIPENEKGLFIAKWRQTDSTDFAKAVKLGLLKQDEIDKGEEQVKKMYDDMSTEGLDKSKELWQEYIKTRSKGESYPDWYRRTKLLPKKADELGFNIPGPDWCFPGETLISTDNGYKRIDDISVGDLVMTRSGFKPVLETYKRKVNEELVELTWLGDTANKVAMTANHPVYSNGVFIEAKDLQVSDSLFPIVNNTAECASINIIDYLPNEKYKLIDEYIVSKLSGPKQKMNNHLNMSDEIYWLFGWFLAEGNIRFCDNRVRGIEFTLSLDEEEIAQKLCEVIKNAFDIDCHYTKRYRATGDCISIVIQSQIIGYLFQSLCGLHSYNKRPIFPGSSRQQFIAAMSCLAGDGSFEKNRAVLNTVSLQLALWFRDSLVNNNYVASFRKGKLKTGRTCYYVSWLKTSKRQGRTILKIDKIMLDGYVYNLNVADSNEYFTLFGLVHNCGFNPNVDLDDIKLKVVDNLGESIQDYDLWPTREKQLAYKQAFINDQAVAPVQQPNRSSPEELRNNIQKILTQFNIHDVQIDVTMGSGNNHVNMDIQEDRSAELKERLRAS